MPDSHQIRCYAIRRVNPFLGVLQILETPDGRALSANGVVWDIEPSSPVEMDANGASMQCEQLAYYRYGLWSEAEGLVNRPLASIYGEDVLKRQAERLIRGVQRHLERMPFALQDTRELWLYDRENRLPLALLASATPDHPPLPPDPRHWASSIGMHGVPSQRRHTQAARLEAMVKTRAGFNINSHWIERLSDGSGIIEASGTRVEAEAFPPFLITEDWPDTREAELAAEFVAWTAPALLTLQHLSRDQRNRLERSLHVQAQSVEHHWHLYPEILENRFLKAARVQCRLLKQA